MTGKAKTPSGPQAADPQHTPQQNADNGGLGEAENFANIEPDGGANFANIQPDQE